MFVGKDDELASRNFMTRLITTYAGNDITTMSSFDYEEANERFLRLEEELDLFDFYVDDVLIWERIRNQVSNQIVDDLGLVSTPNELSSSSGGGDTLSLKTCAKNSIFNNPFFASEDAEILFYSHGRRKLMEGVWWDIVIDPVAEQVDRPFICVENYGDSSHPTPSKTKNLYYKDVISGFTGLGKRLSQFWSPLHQSEKNRIGEIEHRIYNVFGTDLDLIQTISEEIIAHRIRFPLYRRLLKQLSPEVVVVWTRPHTLVEAANSVGIPVVELQHGMIYRYNFDYHFPGDRKSESFADYLFTFGDHWTTAVDYPIPAERVRTTGYPYTELVLDKYKEQETSEDTVLFLSQPYVGNRLSKFAAEFAGLANGSKVVYKLHPREYDDWEQRYPCLKDVDIQVVDSDTPELYNLLSRASTQVGVSSTALYEGTLFDLETYLLDLPKVSTMEYFLERGVPIVQNPPNLNESINAGAGLVPDSRPLFAESPIETTVNALQEIG